MLVLNITRKSNPPTFCLLNKKESFGTHKLNFLTRLMIGKIFLKIKLTYFIKNINLNEAGDDEKPTDEKWEMRREFAHVTWHVSVM